MNNQSIDRGTSQLDSFTLNSDVKLKPYDQSTTITSALSWPQPREIESELLPVIPFSATLLPQCLSDFVLDEADRMPCSPDFVAATLVVALGSLIGSSCVVRPKSRDDTWLVTANLWGGIIGDPSSRKTPAISTVMKNIDRLERLETEKMDSQKAPYLANLAAYKAIENAIHTQMKKVATSDENLQKKETKMEAAKSNLAALLEPIQPSQRRFKSNDATVEKLGDLLVTNSAGLLVLRDELIGLLASWDKVSKVILPAINRI